MQFDPAVVTAIMGLLGIGVIGIIEFLKRILKTEGIAWANFLIALAVSLAATAVILVQIGGFTWIAFLGYGLMVFGEATGLYHVYMKKA